MFKLLIILIVGLCLGFWFARRPESIQSSDKVQNKQKILDVLANKSRITNDEVQRLLGVSDATATRYLEELEREGKVKQIGEAGKYVYYVSTSSTLL